MGIAAKKASKVRAAVEPFAQVSIPENRTGDDVWIYVGKWDGEGEPPHLNVKDFETAKEALR